MVRLRPLGFVFIVEQDFKWVFKLLVPFTDVNAERVSHSLHDTNCCCTLLTKT